MFLHPVHVSVTNIDIDVNNKKIDYSIKLFQDDLSALIYHYYAINIFFDKEKDLTEKQYMVINEYIAATFIIKVNNKPLSDLKFQKKELNEGGIWLYYSGTWKDKKIITIKDQLMVDFFFDQNNMVILGLNGKEYGYMFNKSSTNKTIKL
jgi:hypothetical protein